MHKYAALSMLLGALLAGCAKAPPNFVFILADDFGYMDVGAYNPDTFYETPNLDRLAREGMRFTAAYAAAPVCSPTRASIQTGLYPARLRTTDFFGGPQPHEVGERWRATRPLLPAPYMDALPHDTETIAEALQTSGYRTFFAGKWHLGPEGSWPEDHGYQINKGGHRSGGPYGPGRYFVPYGNPRLEDGPPGEHLPARLAQETARFIQESQGVPFLAFLSFYSVHTPLMTRPELEAKYQAKPAPASTWGIEGARRVRQVQNHAVYAGMVESMDTAIGVVLRALDSLNLADNTVVIFTSDNGGLSTSEGHPTSNLPLRAGKGWLYEGGIREPTIVRYPRVVEGNTVSDIPIISIDFFPTMIELAGQALRNVDGTSLAALLGGAGALDRTALFWHYPHYGNQGGAPGSAVRQGPWKLIHFYEDGRTELYNLDQDVSESQAVVNADTAQALKARLDTWLTAMHAQMPSHNTALDTLQHQNAL